MTSASDERGRPSEQTQFIFSYIPCFCKMWWYFSNKCIILINMEAWKNFLIEAHIPNIYCAFRGKSNINKYIYNRYTVFSHMYWDAHLPAKLQDVFVRSTDQHTTRIDGRGWQPHWWLSNATCTCPQLSLQKYSVTLKMVLLYTRRNILNRNTVLRLYTGTSTLSVISWPRPSKPYFITQDHAAWDLYSYNNNKTTTTTTTTTNITTLWKICCFLTLWGWNPSAEICRFWYLMRIVFVICSILFKLTHF